MELKHNIRHRNGFTLVELAIVIVIIGLLVAGVMTGQTLIEQAKFRKIISEYNGYKASVMTFRSKFNQLPGDFNKATQIWGQTTDACWGSSYTDTNVNRTCNGDNDGIIDYPISGGSPEWEPWRTWQHLSLAKMTRGEFTGRAAAYVEAVPGLDIPTSSAMNGSAWILFYYEDTVWNVGVTGKKHVFILGGTSGPNPRTWANPSMTPTEMFSIDLKLDDGRPASGTVQSFLHTSYGAVNCSQVAGEYNIANNDKVCLLVVDL